MGENHSFKIFEISIKDGIQYIELPDTHAFIHKYTLMYTSKHVCAQSHICTHFFKGEEGEIERINFYYEVKI